MRILHIISCMVKADGHSQFCMALAEHMAASGVEQRIFTVPSQGGESLPDPTGLVCYARGCPIHVFNVAVRLGLKRQLTTVMRAWKPDVVHLHGGWHPVLFFGARFAKRMGIPIVLSLHGSLRPVVVEGDRRLKKRLAWRVYQRRLVAMADVIQVSSEAERDDPARLGFNKPIAVVPNGVDFEDFSRKDAKAQRTVDVVVVPNGIDVGGSSGVRECGSAIGNGAHTRTVLYLGRLHPVKGLDLLVSAWERIVSDFSGWQLLIVGPDEKDELARLRGQVQRLGLEERVTFGGPLYGEVKARVMAEADLFILPTRGENFGSVVAEALACGVPVITTTGVPWKELLGSSFHSSLVEETGDGGQSSIDSGSRQLGEPCSDHARMNSRTNELGRTKRAGWWVEPDAEALAGALREAMRLTDAERQAMGENGRRLVERKYRWKTVAEKMMEVYKHLLNL